MSDSGFQILEGVLSVADCDRMVRSLSGRATGRAGARHLMSHPPVAELARSSELMEIARRWLGASAVPYRCTLFEKSGERNWLVVWHQDTTLPLTARVESSEWGPWSTKERILYAHAPTWALERIVALRVHLDASTPENGPLKVIPGSHREGVLTDAQVFEMAKRSALQELTVGVGGVLAMRPLLIHASSKAQDRKSRRVLHIEYATSLDLAPGIRVALA